MRSLVAAILLCLLCSPAVAETCIASVYSTHDSDQNGTVTASGIPLRNDAMTIAHSWRKLRTSVVVTNVRTGKSQKVLITDRGPNGRARAMGRCVDLTQGSAKAIRCSGLCPVTVEAQ